MSLLHIPTEILSKILSHYDRPLEVKMMRMKSVVDTLRNLRLVSRAFNTLASPLLFRVLCLTFEEAGSSRSPDVSRCWNIINALSSPSNTANEVFSGTRMLHLATHRLYASRYATKRPKGTTLEQKLPVVITSLRGVQSVRYVYSAWDDPGSLTMKIVEALGTLPSLQVLDLIINGIPPPPFTLQPISNLRKLRFELRIEEESESLIQAIAVFISGCSNLSDLAISGHVQDAPPLRLGDFFSIADRAGGLKTLQKLTLFGISATPEDLEPRIHHFRRLNSLSLRANTSPGRKNDLGRVCRILHQNGIDLKELETDAVDDEVLLEHLSSHQGLERLCLDPEDHEGDFSEPISKLFGGVLPAQRETLRELSLYRGRVRKTAWYRSLARGHLAAISECVKLRKLSVRCLVPDVDIRDMRTGSLYRWLEVSGKAPLLAELDISAAVQSTGVDSDEDAWMDSDEDAWLDYDEDAWAEYAISSFKSQHEVTYGIRVICQ